MKILNKLTSLILIGTLPITFAGCDNSKKSDKNSAIKNESSAIEETQPETTEAPTQATTQPKIITLKDCDIPTFELTSESLKDGVWDTSITNTDNGSNQSPQLSWESVSDAQLYSIYMIDTSAGNWTHWVSQNVTETTLAQGWASEEEYIGPYPPSGTHDYEIYVFALKEQPSEEFYVDFDGGNGAFFTNIMALDKNSSSDSGNIISYGHIKGTYTCGD